MPWDSRVLARRELGCLFWSDPVGAFVASGFWDQLFAALDVLTIKMLQEIIVNLQQENRITVIICDHQARDLLACCDLAMILSNGRIVAQDTPSNLVKNIEAKNAYFGESFKFN